jgi:hypothetical protein
VVDEPTGGAVARRARSTPRASRRRARHTGAWQMVTGRRRESTRPHGAPRAAMRPVTLSTRRATPRINGTRVSLFRDHRRARAGRIVLFGGSARLTTSDGVPSSLRVIADHGPEVRPAPAAVVSVCPKVLTHRSGVTGRDVRTARRGQIYPGRLWTTGLDTDKLAYRHDWIRGSVT